MIRLFLLSLMVATLHAHEYMSLRHEKTNVRYGPETTFPLKFTWYGAGLPLEIVSHKDTWTQVKDHEGDQGWVQRRMLSKKRTVLCQKDTELRAQPGSKGAIVAFLKQGVAALLLKEESGYCYVSLLGAHTRLKGWIPQAHLWGVA